MSSQQPSDTHPKPTDEPMGVALALARRALGTTAPNPAVGCVITSGGQAAPHRILGRGATQPGGRPHAETVALAQARDLFGAEAVHGATAHVTLEPCSHHGQTGPCADALIEAGIGAVSVAMVDPDPRVAGRGIARLRAAGIQVSVGIGGAEAAEVNEGFVLHRTQGRPLITWKAATTWDGRIATASGRSQWITGPEARARGHLLRADHDAILIGSGTALADDPTLTCRLPGLEDRSPIRVVVDRRLRLPPTTALLRDCPRVPLWIITGTDSDPAARQALEAAGAVLQGLDPEDGPASGIESVVRLLAGRGITRLLVEGGGTLASALLSAGLVDRVAWFHAPKVIGGDGLPAAAAFGVDQLADSPVFAVLDREMLGPDVLTVAARSNFAKSESI